MCLLVCLGRMLALLPKVRARTIASIVGASESMDRVRTERAAAADGRRLRSSLMQPYKSDALTRVKDTAAQLA